jgi:hypothetical protein
MQLHSPTADSSNRAPLTPQQPQALRRGLINQGGVLISTSALTQHISRRRLREAPADASGAGGAAPPPQLPPQPQPQQQLQHQQQQQLQQQQQAGSGSDDDDCPAYAADEPPDFREVC